MFGRISRWTRWSKIRLVLVLLHFVFGFVNTLLTPTFEDSMSAERMSLMDVGLILLSGGIAAALLVLVLTFVDKLGSWTLDRSQSPFTSLPQMTLFGMDLSFAAGIGAFLAAPIAARFADLDAISLSAALYFGLSALVYLVLFLTSAFRRIRQPIDPT